MSDEQTTQAEPEITEATVSQASKHIAAVAHISYSAAEVQAKQMNDAERVAAMKIKTGNDMHSHSFDVSRRLAKESQQADAKAVVDPVVEPVVEPVLEPAEPVEAETEPTVEAVTEPEAKPTTKKKTK